MSLLKSLQTQLTRMQTPWKPVQSPYIHYLINSLVLKEESDLGADDEYASHYEMYCNAIQAMKADTGLMDNLMAHIETNMSVIKAIELSCIPGPVKDFLEYTFWIVQKTSLHEQAAVLWYDQEGFGHQLIYQRAVVLQQNHAEELNSFLYYLRHKNEIKEKYHSQLSAILLKQLWGDDEKKWHEATQAANQSLRNRIRLVDYIHEKIVASKN
jgi:hypothetical protein